MDIPLTERELQELIGAGYRYACALRVDPADAEDLVQESWLKVVKAYGPNPSKAVLIRAIRNLYIDHFRHAQRFQHISINDAPLGLSDDNAERSVSDVGDPQLNRCLAKLRVAEREALFLTVVEGYTAEEVAKLTNSPRGTVLSMIHRARMKLRTYLMEEEGRVAPKVDVRGLK